MLTAAPHLQVRRPSPTTAEFTVTTCPAPTLSRRLLLGIVLLSRVLLGLSVLLLLYSTWTLSPFYHPEPSAGVETATQTAAGTTSSCYEGIPCTIDDDSVNGYGDGDGDGNSNSNSNGHISIDIDNSRPTSLYPAAWGPYLVRAIHLATRLGQTTTQRLAACIPSYLLLPLCAVLLYATTLRIHTTESLLVLRGLGIQTSSTGGSYLASWRAGTRFIPTEKIRDVLINEAFRGFAVRYYLLVVVDGEDDVVVVFPRLLPRRSIVETVWRGVRGCLWEPQDGSQKSSYG